MICTIAHHCTNTSQAVTAVISWDRHSGTVKWAAIVLTFWNRLMKMIRRLKKVICFMCPKRSYVIPTMLTAHIILQEWKLTSVSGFSSGLSPHRQPSPPGGWERGGWERGSGVVRLYPVPPMSVKTAHGQPKVSPRSAHGQPTVVREWR